LQIKVTALTEVVKIKDSISNSVFSFIRVIVNLFDLLD